VLKLDIRKVAERYLEVFGNEWKKNF
jgi:hypothetical protein